MHPAAEGLAGSLLYEGYALYPYTPGATKNATPTPFGIVYPKAYAEQSPATYDHASIECVLDAKPGAEVDCLALFLVSAGPRHQAAQHRAEVAPVAIADVINKGPTVVEFERGEVAGSLSFDVSSIGGDAVRIIVSVSNETELDELEAAAIDRPEALRSSLLSVHLLVSMTGEGRFLSPLTKEGPLAEAVASCSQINSWPVLAAPGDVAVMGAPIILPDHPEVSAESRVDLFDNTEIEEALLLHVHTMSEGEREQAAKQDPKVAEMIERAAATTPEDIMALHGTMKPSDEQSGHPVPGEHEVTVGDATFRKGGKVVLHPDGRDLHDTMLDGKVATIERIFVDMDGEARLGVTVDDDPARELFSETGRYLFFRARELEPAEAS